MSHHWAGGAEAHDVFNCFHGDAVGTEVIDHDCAKHELARIEGGRRTARTYMATELAGACVFLASRWLSLQILLTEPRN